MECNFTRYNSNLSNYPSSSFGLSNFVGVVQLGLVFTEVLFPSHYFIYHYIAKSDPENYIFTPVTTLLRNNNNKKKKKKGKKKKEKKKEKKRKISFIFENKQSPVGHI